MATLAGLITFFNNNRDFKPSYYLAEKTRVINKFFSDEGLDSAVIGLSGGVDSAVVYKLLLAAAALKDSPIKAVHGVFIPINTKGITGQDVAGKNVNDLLKSVEGNDKARYSLIDATPAVNELIKSYDEIKLNDWATGQMACIVRTPILYGQAAFMQTIGYKSLVVGTTNRDEGSYIGFFGKASDAMVDLQPIADIHKDEVYEIAKLLNVPESIIKAKPKGDVWDSKVDEEMIGAPYWFLKMYLLMLDYNLEIGSFKKSITDKKEKNLFKKYADAIEKIHKTNAHKYKVGSPARFIDVMTRKINGGWE